HHQQHQHEGSGEPDPGVEAARPPYQGADQPGRPAVLVAACAQLVQVGVAVAVEATGVVGDEQRQAGELVGVEVVVTAVRSRQTWHGASMRRTPTARRGASRTCMPTAICQGLSESPYDRDWASDLRKRVREGPHPVLSWTLGK